MFNLSSQGGVGCIVPTNADMLEGLHMACGRHMDVSFQPGVFSELLRRELIQCERRQHTVRKPCVQCVGGAWLTVSVTDRGYAALDWLLSIARSSRWEQRRSVPYGD